MIKGYFVSLREFLSRHPTSATAPCRIDTGGTWDIKAMALPFQGIKPITVNMALNLRTSVTLLPYKDGAIKISSRGFPEGKTFSLERPSFRPPFGIFCAAVSFFGFHGFEVRIESESPVKSALGGSSTALVALIKALDKSRKFLDGAQRTSDEILHLAYHIEDAISGGNCGIQDQAAAVYGGVNLWTWEFGNKASPFVKTPLLDRKGQKRLSERLLVAFSGRSHVSSITNRKWLEDFLSGKTRDGWIAANEVVRGFAGAIGEQSWLKAAEHLKEEMAIRRKITPEALIPETEKLIGQAEQSGCGARFTGAGAGGSLWAIGEKDNIDRLRNTWEKTLAGIKDGEIIPCQVEPEGLK